jgi:hypothetical protein
MRIKQPPFVGYYRSSVNKPLVHQHPFIISSRYYIILRDNQVNHRIVITDNSNDKNNNKSPNEKATQAYKLYTEGNKPVQVAIQLGLSEKEATRYYTEYWRLMHLYKLHSIYKELKGDLSPILKLYRLLKREGITRYLTSVDIDATYTKSNNLFEAIGDCGDEYR